MEQKHFMDIEHIREEDTDWQMKSTFIGGEYMKSLTAKEAKKIAKEHVNKAKNKNRSSDSSVDLELIWISDFIKRTAEQGGRCCFVGCDKIDMGKEVAIKKALTKRRYRVSYYGDGLLICW